MIQQVIFWGIVFAVLTVAELMTVQLISIWLALAALVTMFFAILEVAFWQQVLIFVIVSAILLLATRPLVRKFIKTKIVATNLELDIGKTAIVIEEIDTNKTKGRATLNGVDWSARTSDNSIVPAGTTVTVEKIEGSKLIVHV